MAPACVFDLTTLFEVILVYDTGNTYLAFFYVGMFPPKLNLLLLVVSSHNWQHVYGVFGQT